MITSTKKGTTQPDGTFQNNKIKVGESFKVTFNNPGNFEYVDSLHPTVPGKINVR